MSENTSTSTPSSSINTAATTTTPTTTAPAGGGGGGGEGEVGGVGGVGLNVAVVGCTGSIGRSLIDELQSNPSIGSILALTRRKYFSPVDYPKVKEKIIDFNSLSPAEFESSSIVYSALGTTKAEAGGAQEFIAQDRDLIIKVATQARSAPNVRHFSLVSSLGADSNSRFLYTRVKGEIEEKVKALQFPSLTIVRPSGLDNSSYPRAKPRLGETIAIGLMKTLFWPLVSWNKYAVIKVEDVGKTMIFDSLDRTRGEGFKLFEGTTEMLNYCKQQEEQNKKANKA